MTSLQPPCHHVQAHTTHGTYTPHTAHTHHTRHIHTTHGTYTPHTAHTHHTRHIHTTHGTYTPHTATQHIAHNTYSTQLTGRRAQGTQYRAQSTEDREQNTKHREQNTKHREQNTKHRAQSAEHTATRYATHAERVSGPHSTHRAERNRANTSTLHARRRTMDGARQLREQRLHQHSVQSVRGALHRIRSDDHVVLPADAVEVHAVRRRRPRVARYSLREHERTAGSSGAHHHPRITSAGGCACGVRCM
jgi:hypothetical protein